MQNDDDGENIYTTASPCQSGSQASSIFQVPGTRSIGSKAIFRATYLKLGIT